MTAGDLAQVAALDRAQDYWSRQQWQAELDRPHGFHYVGALERGKIACCCCGIVAGGEAEIFRLAVACHLQRRGVGYQLGAAVLAGLRRQGADQCWLEVRPSNQAALALYRKLGFRRCGSRKNYYRHPEEDALLLTITLGNHDEQH